MKNNINGNAIEKLCREYTKLTDEEIEIIQIAAQSLPAMASMFDADAFIDCPLEDAAAMPSSLRRQDLSTEPLPIKIRLSGWWQRRKRNPRYADLSAGCADEVYEGGDAGK